MRLLRIDDNIIELDSKTVIGIDVQNLDLTKPSKRTVNKSNSFSIPRTIDNLKAIGYIGGFQNANDSLYNNYSIQYYLNNEEIISGSFATIQKISDRITLQIVRKATLWDDMKSLGWSNLRTEYLAYIQEFQGVNSDTNYFVGTEEEAIESYIDRSNQALKLYPAYGTEMDTLGYDYLTPQSDTFIMLSGNSIGTHFWSDAKTLFKFIENKYGVDFDILGSHSDNPFNQTRFQKCIWMLRGLSLASASATDWYIRDFISIGYTYTMQEEATENDNGDVYGLLFSILNIYGIIIEQYAKDKYRLRDISLDIDTKRPIDIGLKLDKAEPKITPNIKGYGQESIIKYENYSDGINSVNTRKIVECNNKNIQFRKDIIKIENFVPAVKDDLLNYGVANSFEQYKIATYEDDINTYVWRRGSGYAISRTYNKPIIHNLSTEWGILDTALNNPLYVEQKFWLTPTQYSKINNWTNYYIPELAGAYYINRVKGYNPEKSLQAVTLELIRINNKTPE
jgi:hypothetical protein